MQLDKCFQQKTLVSAEHMHCNRSMWIHVVNTYMRVDYHTHTLNDCLHASH